jgi:recombination protein RecA
MVIPREARRITYSTEIRNLKKHLSLNQTQKEVLTGCILGDAHLEVNISKTNCRLKISQSIKQSSYVRWKYGIFKEWVLTKPKLHVKTKSLRFTTISHKDITAFHRMFYQGKVKHVPDNIDDMLTPLSLAVWFMDDGNAVRRNGKIYGYNINTQSFEKGQQEMLLKLIESRYDIHGMLERNNNKYRIAIWKRDSRMKFHDLISRYMIKDMRYKIG